MASRRFVLPWPLSPAKTLKAGAGSRRSGARLRKPVSLSERRSRADSDAHRHDDAEMTVVAHGTNEQGVELTAELGVEALGFDLTQELEHVLWIDTDGQRRAVVLRLDLFLDLAQIGVVAGDAQRTGREREPDPACLGRHELGTFESVGEERATDLEDLVVRLGDDRLVGRELRVDELHRERDLGGAEKEVRSLDGDVACPARRIERALDLNQTF